MRSNRDWMKLGALVVVAAILVIGFTSMVDLPRDSMAQPATPSPIFSSQPQQRPAIPEARPLAELGNAFTAVAEAARPAVVFIEVEKRTEPFHSSQRLPSPFDRFFQQDQTPRIQEGSGSGFIVSGDGYILTNNHVVEGADRVDVRLADDRRFEKAKVVGGDPLTDVAVIKIDAENLPTILLGNSDSVSVGQWVLAIGNPLGDAFTFTVTAGIVSARGRLLRRLQSSNWDIQDFIQTDAAINRGNSGGPLVNIRGEVVGINSAIASETGFYNGYGFAIPINLAQQVADQLIREGRVVRAALGVTIVAVDQEAADYVGLDEIRGVVIAGFPDDSPARRAGLRERDVIVEVAGEKVEYSAQLQTIVGFKRPGETIDVTVMRHGGERRTYSVRLKEAETDTPQTVASRPSEESGRSGTLAARLGISVEEFTQDDASRMGLRSSQVEYGLLVTDVDRDGPARDKVFAGSPSSGYIEVITHVDDTQVRTQRDLNAALVEVPAGDVVSLRVVRITGNEPEARFAFVRTTGNRR